MSDVTDRITARLDAMEAVARAAATWGRTWVTMGNPDGTAEVVTTHPQASILVATTGAKRVDPNTPVDSHAQHIALNDPAAVLRIVAGLRAVVAACLPDYEAAKASGDDTTELVEEVLAAIATMWEVP